MFVSDNELVRQPHGLWKIWFTTEATDYWPVSYSIFWGLWQIFGGWTLPYHLTAIAIHVVNVGLVERILDRLKFKRASLAALLFAVHPVNAESVAWIFQIKTTSSAAFALLALLFWLSDRTRASALTFTAGLLSKTAIVTWPFVLLEASWWRDRRLNRRELVRLVPFLVLSLVTGLVGLFWYRYGELTGGERVRTDHGIETWVIAARAFWFYVGKAFWPAGLTFVYPRWTIDLSDWREYVPLTGLALAFLASGYALWTRRVRGAPAVFAYVLTTLFPVLGFVDVYYFRFSFVADHYQYLALLGPMCLVAWILGLLPRPVRLGLGLLLIGGGAYLTHSRAKAFVGEPAAWADTLARNPTAWLALYNSGNIAYGEGRYEAARDFYTRALTVKPDYADALVGLGAVDLAQSDEARARQRFERALEIFPGHARALNNLAALALSHGDAARAASYLEEATRRLPDYALGFKNLGLVYMRLGDRPRALGAMKRAHELRPEDADVEANLERLQRAP